MNVLCMFCLFSCVGVVDLGSMQVTSRKGRVQKPNQADGTLDPKRPDKAGWISPTQAVLECTLMTLGLQVPSQKVFGVGSEGPDTF